MTNRTVVFSDKPFPNLFKSWEYRWDLPTIWNTRLLQTPIEEFFRNTTGILVLEGKTGKKIPQSLCLEFLVNFLANNFALLDPEDSISGSINSRFIFVENTISDRVSHSGGGAWEPLFLILQFFSKNSSIKTDAPPLLLKMKSPHLKNKTPPPYIETWSTPPWHDS